jgi:hypothetical protein
MDFDKSNCKSRLQTISITEKINCWQILSRRAAPYVIYIYIYIYYFILFIYSHHSLGGSSILINPYGTRNLYTYSSGMYIDFLFSYSSASARACAHLRPTCAHLRPTCAYARALTHAVVGHSSVARCWASKSKLLLRISKHFSTPWGLGFEI